MAKNRRKTKEKLYCPPLVLIEWRDVASVDMGMFTAEEIDPEKLPRAFIVGFLVKETNNAYYLAKESWDTKQFKYLHIIPKATAILNITKFTGRIDNGDITLNKTRQTDYNTLNNTVI